MNPAELFSREPNTVGLAPGESLFREGDEAAHMFILLEGEVEILVGTKVVDVPGPGALIGEMALIDHAPRAASVVAKTQCRLAKIDVPRFHFIIRQNPFFATHVMKVLVDRIRKMDKLLAPDEGK
jgi:CRP/FNR family cyclic AMP-dependent transcriptional regulator